MSDTTRYHVIGLYTMLVLHAGVNYLLASEMSHDRGWSLL